MSTSSRNKGSGFEREVARQLGGKRAPLSGAVGGGDLWMPSGSIWADWTWELKRRKALPHLVTAALTQAAGAAQGGRTHPAMVMRGDNGRSIFCAYLDDVVQWAEALAEMGQGAKVRTLAKQAMRIIEEIERHA